MMDVLVKKVSVLELSNNPGTATAARPVPLPVTSPAAALRSGSYRPVEIEKTVRRRVESHLHHVPTLLSDTSPGLSSSDNEPVPKRWKQLKSGRDRTGATAAKNVHYLAP